MFTNYEIKRIGYDEVMYLYLDLKYEFASLIENNDELTKRCFNFINNYSINFTGNKIYLVINGIIVKVLDLRSIK